MFIIAVMPTCELRLHYLIGPLCTLESWSVTVASLELLCGLKVCRLSIKCTRVNTTRAHVRGYCFISIVINGPRTSVDRYQCRHIGIDPAASRACSQVWLNTEREKVSPAFLSFVSLTGSGCSTVYGLVPEG